MKEKKNDESKRIWDILKKKHNIDLTYDALAKKIKAWRNNVKNKKDARQMGDREIPFTEFEDRFYRLLGGRKNPAISKQECEYIYILKFID